MTTRTKTTLAAVMLMLLVAVIPAVIEQGWPK